MQTEYVTIDVHNEFARRIDEENNRQNKRIETLESTVRQISELTLTVKELAVNLTNMTEEQKRQGERLKDIEDRDGEMWREVLTHAATALVGGLVAFFLARIGLI